MIEVKISGLRQLEQLTLNVQKNTNKFIGASGFELAKKTASIAKKSFRNKHSKYGTGKSANTIIAVKIDNNQSQVLGNEIVGWQEYGTDSHSEPNNPFKNTWRTAPNHPGTKPKKVVQNASKKALKHFPEINAKNFSKWISVK